VDRWEAAYNRYYRLPGYEHSISSDIEPEQREFEAQRRVLSELLPRAGQLCLKHGLANPFPGLMRSSLGQHVPQLRVESAVGRNERNAVADCLSQLTDACHGWKTTTNAEACNSAFPTRGFRRDRLLLTIGVCAFAALLIPGIRHFSGIQLPGTGPLDQQPYGKRSGAELRATWEAGRKQESARLTDADLKRMVDRLFVQNDPGRKNFHGLLYAGARPLPFLLKALDDPRTPATVFSKKDFDPIEMSPFGRICALLDDLGPAEAAKSLARYVDHPDPMFRREAASLLARIGCAGCLEPVKKALTDRDPEVRQFALIGLKGGLEKRPRDETFASGIFPLLLPLLNAGTYDTVSPAQVMMAADPVRAAAILESAQYFASGNPQLGKVLEALDHKDVKVPQEILFPLLSQLESLAATKPPAEWNYAMALVLYANNPDDQAESRFRSLIYSPSSTIASTAAHSLEVLAGVDPHGVVFDVYEKRGFAAMTGPQQFYFAVALYRDEVKNGGHNQYFYNDDSDLYRVAVDGLRAIGAASRAVILSDAARAFALATPAPAEEARREQMELFGPTQDRIFRNADQRFFDSEKDPGQRLDVLLTVYALQHRGDFAATLLQSETRLSQQ
jgi:hypothetical protein